ncbi:pilin [Pseudofrankia asymbiotica]|uniref:TrbC/VIRB2 family protein n=1 Tax=Pseudofrankia asymbiotica TaxID=1834516 RepID=A0A1V2I4E4_9ACTN|nr:pilin [Pseudofrankia asymbiotica]ONH25232.1 hypothetical protein BL253_28090 [Pseudofrankia asymbiotica]
MSPTPPAQARPSRSRRRVAWRRTVLLVAVVGVLVLAGGTAAFAAVVPPGPPVATDLNTVLNNIRNWIMGILGTVATVFLSIGGFRYMMAHGDPGEINRAKDALRNAGWGYGFTALAPVVVEILKTNIGG